MQTPIKNPATPLLEFQPLTDADWPEELLHFQGEFAGKLNVYRIMAHNPSLLHAWANLREHVVRNTALGPARSEVVILRTGHRFGSIYEWSHHVSRARRCGIDDARISTFQGPVEAMEPEDAILAGAVDELLTDAKLTERTIKRLVALVGKEGVLDLMATVGFYATLAFIVNTFKTPVDAPIAQELADRPLTS